MQLRELITSGTTAPLIARKLGRFTDAVYARVYPLKKAPERALSLPSERAAFYHRHAASKPATDQ
jgi:hypothetical protein